MYAQVGWAAFVPAAVVVLQIPVQIGLARFFSRSRYVHRMLLKCSSCASYKCKYVLRTEFTGFRRNLNTWPAWLHACMWLCSLKF